jgi:DNA-binding transcriptional ArsR family regulator
VTLDLPTLGSMLADRTRATILLECLDGRLLPASELAARARVSRSLASTHLRKLERAGLLRVEAHGRHRSYGIASPELAVAIEALGTVATLPPPAPRLRDQLAREALRHARSCYDHLAGEVGVAVTEALCARGALELRGAQFELRDAQPFARLGVDTEAAAGRSRAFARSCLDWTERRPHLAGALGAALLASLLEHGWVVRLPSTRALRVTPAGIAALERELLLHV